MSRVNPQNITLSPSQDGFDGATLWGIIGQYVDEALEKADFFQALGSQTLSLDSVQGIVPYQSVGEIGDFEEVGQSIAAAIIKAAQAQPGFDLGANAPGPAFPRELSAGLGELNPYRLVQNPETIELWRGDDRYTHVEARYNPVDGTWCDDLPNLPSDIPSICASGDPQLSLDYAKERIRDPGNPAEVSYVHKIRVAPGTKVVDWRTQIKAAETEFRILGDARQGESIVETWEVRLIAGRDGHHEDDWEITLKQ